MSPAELLDAGYDSGFGATSLDSLLCEHMSRQQREEFAAFLIALVQERERKAALDWWFATRSAPPARTARNAAEEQWAAAWARHDDARLGERADRQPDQNPAADPHREGGE